MNTAIKLVYSRCAPMPSDDSSSMSKKSQAVSSIQPKSLRVTSLMKKIERLLTERPGLVPVLEGVVDDLIAAGPSTKESP